MSEFDFIKEKRPSKHGGGIAVIRSDRYGSNYPYFTAMWEQAKADFPDLEPSNAEFVQYGGRSYARTFGLEFPYEGDGPADYRVIASLEFKLG